MEKTFAIHRIKNYMKKKNLFFYIVLLEILFLAGSGLLVFQKPANLELQPQDFQETGYYQVGDTENGIGALGLAEPEESTVLLLESNEFALHPGAYEVVIQYDSAYNPDDPLQSAANKMGRVDMITEENPMALKTFSFFLPDGHTSQTGRMWLRSGSEVSDLRAEVYYCGTGKLLIQSISIREQILYRYVRIAGFLLLFAALDLLYLIFSKNTILKVSEKRKWEILVLGIIILTSSLPYLTDFLYAGHDLEFHIHRIYRLSESIQDMLIPQRIAFQALNGYGYASPLTYGELFLYIPAVLHCLWVPMQTCYQIYVIMINACTCLISYWCFKRICKDWRMGIVGGAVYTLSGYRMANLLTRASVGEYTAMAFLPLVCYGFWYVYQKKDEEKIRFRECLPIIIGLTGIVESHILSCEMSAFFVLIVVVLFRKKTFAKYRFIALCKSAVVTLLLNLWFLVPCLSSMLGMNLGARHVGARIENKGVYLIQLFGIFQSRNGRNVLGGMLEEMPLTLGITLTLGLLLYLICCIKRESWKLAGDSRFKYAGIFAGFAAIALFMSSNYFWSDNLVNRWKIIKMVYGTLQFPWRFLAMATVFASFVLVLCLSILYEKKGEIFWAGTVAVIVIPGILSAGLYMTDFTHSAYEERYYSYASEDPVPSSSAIWFELTGTDNDLANIKTPLLGEGVSASEVVYSAGTYTVNCANEMEGISFITFPVFHYNNYHVYDREQGYELPIQTGENNRVQVELPGRYSGTLVLRYEVPLYWRICEAVSFITLLFVLFYQSAFFYLIKGRMRCSHESI